MIPSMSSPFGFVPASTMPVRPTEWLTFEIPADDMRLSEARAWADFKAAQWAEANRTKIVGSIDWRVDEMSISALVTLTGPPVTLTPTGRVRKKQAKRTENRKPAPHDGCAICEDVAAFPAAWTHVDIAAELRINVSTVQRHRVRSQP